MSPSSTHHQSWTGGGGLGPSLFLTPCVCSSLDDRDISHLFPYPPEIHKLRLLLGSSTQPILHTANPLMIPTALRGKPSRQHGSQAPTHLAWPYLQTQTSLLPCPLPSNPCSQTLYFPQLKLYTIQRRLCCCLQQSQSQF